LSNDDEPGKLARRELTVTREGLNVGGQEAVLASVDPPLIGNGWGNGTTSVLLASRTRGVTIGQMLDDPSSRPGRVFVLRYLGDATQLPDSIGRDDVSIEFWGLLD
jgi:hypothetical protein